MCIAAAAAIPVHKEHSVKVKNMSETKNPELITGNKLLS